MHSGRSERKGAGENLYYACGVGLSKKPVEEHYKKATDAWYKEVCNPGYKFETEAPAGGTGHFTQVVWKGTQKLGLGLAIGPKNGLDCVYVVGRYLPAGNMIGKYKE